MQAILSLPGGGRSKAWRKVGAEPWFKQAQDIVRKRRFFHGEFEFPEAFSAADSGKTDWKPMAERGFDAVIGNSPYGARLDANETALYDVTLL